MLHTHTFQAEINGRQGRGGSDATSEWHPSRAGGPSSSSSSSTASLVGVMEEGRRLALGLLPAVLSTFASEPRPRFKAGKTKQQRGSCSTGGGKPLSKAKGASSLGLGASRAVVAAEASSQRG